MSQTGAEAPSGARSPTGAAPRPWDAIDRARIRSAVTAAAATVGGGLGVVLGAGYLEVCRGCDSLAALPLIGVLPAWGALCAVAAGRMAWTRGLGAGVAGAGVLAFLALHFVWPAMVGLYAPALWLVEQVGWEAGFLTYWVLAASVMVSATLGMERAVDRLWPP